MSRPGVSHSLAEMTTTVSTLAGTETRTGGKPGYADGAAASALFLYPNGLAIDFAGNVIVADYRYIRKITPAGVVSTLAGDGKQGFTNGAAASARFCYPSGLAIDGLGNVIVVDTSNGCIRKITPAGVVSTLAGDGKQGFTNGAAASAQFNAPCDVAIDGSGNIIVADAKNYCIRKITPAGMVSTLAGSRSGGIRSSGGFANGAAASARFRERMCVAVDGAGNVIVADMRNQLIRKITNTGLTQPAAWRRRQGPEGMATVAEFVATRARLAPKLIVPSPQGSDSRKRPRSADAGPSAASTLQAARAALQKAAEEVEAHAGTMEARTVAAEAKAAEALARVDEELAKVAAAEARAAAAEAKVATAEAKAATAEAQAEEERLKLARAQGGVSALAPLPLAEVERLLTEGRRAVSRLEAYAAHLRQEARQCPVCMDLPTDTVFIPCGHMTCETCAPELSVCPICRVNIQQTQRIMLPP